MKACVDGLGFFLSASAGETQEHDAVEEEADTDKQADEPDGLDRIADSEGEEDRDTQGEDAVEQSDPPVFVGSDFERQGEIGSGIEREIGGEDDPQCQDTGQRMDDDQSARHDEDQSFEPTEPVAFVDLPSVHSREDTAKKQQPAEEKNGR